VTSHEIRFYHKTSGLYPVWTI